MNTISSDRISAAGGGGAVESFGVRLSAAIADFSGAVARWRVAAMLAETDIRNRYRRSKFGQWWLTLSMAITIATLAFVYATLFNIDLTLYLPHVAVSLIAWGLLAAFILEGAQAFVEAENYLKNVRLPLSVFVLRVLFRNLIVFAHNLVLVPVVMLAFRIPLTWDLLWLPLSLVLVVLNGIWIAVLLGTLCARYRDLPQILASVIQVAFFLSPVIWKPAQLSDSIPWLAIWNPFAAFLALLRDPILGGGPPLQAWLYACAITIAGFLVAVPFFARFRSRIVYYL